MGTDSQGKSMKEYTTFEIIALWKRAKDDPFILRYLADLTGLSVNDIVFVLQCYGYQPDVKRALRAESPKKTNQSRLKSQTRNSQTTIIIKWSNV